MTRWGRGRHPSVTGASAGDTSPFRGVKAALTTSSWRRRSRRTCACLGRFAMTRGTLVCCVGAGLVPARLSGTGTGLSHAAGMCELDSNPVIWQNPGAPQEAPSCWEITLILIPNAPRGSGWGAFCPARGAFFRGGVHFRGVGCIAVSC